MPRRMMIRQRQCAAISSSPSPTTICAYNAYKDRISKAWQGVENQRRAVTHEDLR
jgi:hypothetical protein